MRKELGMACAAAGSAIAGTGFLYWPRSLLALIGWEHPRR